MYVCNKTLSYVCICDLLYICMNKWTYVLHFFSIQFTTLNYYLFRCLGQGRLGNLAAQCEGGGGAVAVGPASAVSSHERRGEWKNWLMSYTHVHVCMYAYVWMTTSSSISRTSSAYTLQPCCYKPLHICMFVCICMYVCIYLFIYFPTNK